MRVLDLCAGLQGWRAGFVDDEYVSLDVDARFGCTVTRDVLEIVDLDELGHFDVVVASPPCEVFSVASIGHHWGGGSRAYVPKTADAVLGLRIARHVFGLIDRARAKDRDLVYVIENPRGVLRKLAPRSPTATTWYCQWGLRIAKPTDIWTNIAGAWPRCRNYASDHESAPRGARTGTQGITTAAERAVVPAALARAVRAAAATGGSIDRVPADGWGQLLLQLS